MNANETDLKEDRLNVLMELGEYVKKRCGELGGSVEAVDTWDPYLIGYGAGMNAGLEAAIGMIFSYAEWAERGILFPDSK